MLEYLIVGLIVAAAALYTLRKYLPRSLRERVFGKTADAGCGSGCGSCKSGCETDTVPTPPDGGKHRVIKVHSN
jgi:hypothetical protein